LFILHRHRQFSEQLVRFESLSFQMFPAEPRADPSLHQVTDETDTLWSNLSSEDSLCVRDTPFLVERLAYLRWVLRVSRDVRDLPVDAERVVALLSSGRGASTKTVCDLLSSVRVFGALQSLMKMHPLFDRALLQVLLDDPRSLVLLSRNGRQPVWQRRLSSRLLRMERQIRGDAFSGPSVLGRMLFVDQMPHAQYARLLCGVDVSLDPFPFGGGVTLCDAVSGGCVSPVPFVTSGALQSVHRIGSGLARTFNDSRTAYGTNTSILMSGDHLSEILSYSVAAVHMAKQSLERKKASNVNGMDSSDGLSAVRERIQFSVYDDQRSASEWNLFFAGLTRI
jgi:hypothetical protein